MTSTISDGISINSYILGDRDYLAETGVRSEEQRSSSDEEGGRCRI
jgi:hypothetical protein